jgi:hypothetical protein
MEGENEIMKGGERRNVRGRKRNIENEIMKQCVSERERKINDDIMRSENRKMRERERERKEDCKREKENEIMKER